MTFYRVKPEFDNIHYLLRLSDKRYSSGSKTLEYTFIGCELFNQKFYHKIVNSNPLLSDVFEEVKIYPYEIFRSFGADFWVKDPLYGETEIIDSLRYDRKKLETEFIRIYDKYSLQNTGNYMNIRKRILAGYLSIETLKLCIEHYSEKLRYSTNIK